MYSVNQVTPIVDNYMPAKIQTEQNAQMTQLLAQLAQLSAMAEANRQNAMLQLGINDTDRFRAETERGSAEDQAAIQKLGIGSNYDLGLRQLSSQDKLGQGDLSVKNRALDLEREGQNAQLTGTLAKLNSMKELFGEQTKSANQD